MITVRNKGSRVVLDTITEKQKIDLKNENEPLYNRLVSENKITPIKPKKKEKKQSTTKKL